MTWQQWDMRLSFNGREGLVLHNLAYCDPDQGGRRRPVLHRGSIVEMCVPYAGGLLCVRERESDLHAVLVWKGPRGC